MKQHVTSLFLSLMLLASCTQDDENSIMKLFADKTEPARPERFLALETDSVRAPYLMACLKDELLLADINLNTFVSAFDKESGKWLWYDLTRGNSPDEYLHIVNMRVVNDKLFLWDAGQSAASILTPKDNSLGVEKRINVQSDSCLIAAFQLTPIDEGHFIASGIIKGHRLVVLDDSGKVRTAFGNYPFGDAQTETADTEMAFVNQGEAVYQQAKRRFAISNLMGEAISFYDLTDMQYPRLVKEYHYIAPKYRKTGDGSIAYEKDSPYGFIALASTPDYCIALFNGAAPESAQDYGGNKVLLFDWDGNPVKAYLLDECYTYLTADEETSRLFLLGTDAETLDYKIDILNIAIR